MITAPGIYENIPTAEYLADPCPEPSLTQSIAKIILAQSPAHAWIAHPRLTQNFQRDDHKKYDVGSIAHALLLGRGKEIVVLDHDDWRTKAAKEAREEATLQGKLAVLARDWEKAYVMAEAARYDIATRGFNEDWRAENGKAEVVVACQHDNIWLRSMIDWLSNDRRRVWDYKTTGLSAAPDRLGTLMANAGWPIQAAFQERILNVLDPASAGRREHFFVVQEDYEPYAVSIVRLTEAHMTYGRSQVDRAIRSWLWCMLSGEWPAYPREVQAPELPVWLLSQMEMSDENVRSETSSS